MIFKIAESPNEFEQIHRLNYETFVEEIPQHRPDTSSMLVDKFHDENIYVIAVQDDEVMGMITVRDRRPFSLDQKISHLDTYLPQFNKPCEVRLLAVKKITPKWISV